MLHYEGIPEERHASSSRLASRRTCSDVMDLRITMTLLASTVKLLSSARVVNFK
jgi:hypothetical protein